MTFKELRAQLSRLQQHSGYKSNDDYDYLLNDSKGIPFWPHQITNEEHSRLRKDYLTDRGNSTCCFWDLIGRPVKHNEEKPLFDYQQIILNVLEYFQKIRIKKFRGAGITQLFLEYPAWLSLSGNNYRNKKAFIITGITQELANDHILRLRNLFLQFYPGAIQNMDYTQRTITLNDSVFRAYPAANPEAPRGKTDVFFILADEFDHHTRRQQEDMMSVITPYRPKSDTMIVLNSTTKNPQGLYAEMDKQWSEFLKSLELNRGNFDYKDLLSHSPGSIDYIQKIKEKIKHHYFLLEFDYHWGVGPGKIYTQKEIDEIEEDRTFPGEFCLEYAGELGNVFSPVLIDRAVQLGEQFSEDKIPVNKHCLHSCGVDPGFGSSRTAIVLTEHNKELGKIRVLYAKEFGETRHLNHSKIADICFDLHQKYKNTWFFIDGQNRGFITDLKIKFGEDPDYEKIDDVSPEDNRVIPVTFVTEHKNMLSNLHTFINKEYLAIPEKFDKLLISLKTAVAKEYSLDKEQTSYDDLLDALRLSLKGYKMR
ncbi:MAG TPA: hypothetical protein VF884_03840 [Nitrososphaeraceae archaeon]